MDALTIRLQVGPGAPFEIAFALSGRHHWRLHTAGSARLRV